MYNRLFVKLFKFLEEKYNDDSVFNAVTMLFIIQVIHLTFVFSLIELFGFEIRTYLSFNYSKYVLFPFGFLCIYLLFKYFKKNLNFILIRHENLKPFSLLELIIIIILPLLTMIFLSS